MTAISHGEPVGLEALGEVGLLVEHHGDLRAVHGGQRGWQSWAAKVRMKSGEPGARAACDRRDTIGPARSTATRTSPEAHASVPARINPSATPITASEMCPTSSSPTVTHCRRRAPLTLR